MKLRSSTVYTQSPSKISLLQQRALIAAVSIFYLTIGWHLTGPMSALSLVGMSFPFAIAMVMIFALTFYNGTVLRVDGVPVLTALVLSAQTLVISANVTVTSTLVFVFLVTSSTVMVVLLAERLRAAALALAVTAGIGITGSWLVVPIFSPEFSPPLALLLWLPILAVASLLAWALEQGRGKAFRLSKELERRATSDNLTGVSNRAHINLLAQNEFARARRYTEPFSCLMLDIDEYNKLRSTWGTSATDPIVQVLSGYCVVIMRHCDSFGRLSPHRFLALLPETKGNGALTLAQRMCKDISNLKVSVSGESLSFTISTGAAELHDDDRWAGDILRRAEQALEDAIERGGNTAVLAQPPLTSFLSDPQTGSQEIDPGPT